MKYFNFKRYKFYSFLKNINLRRNKIYTFLKSINLRSFNFERINFKKLIKYPEVKKLIKYPEVKKLIKYPEVKISFLKRYIKLINLKIYINKIKKINFLKSKFLLIHLPLAIVFFIFLYILIPTFYNYEKNEIQNLVCKNKKITCTINGNINYNFYPTPRLKIKSTVIYNMLEKKEILAKVEDSIIILSFKNLLAKDKQSVKKIELSNFQLNLDTKNFKEYFKIFEEKQIHVPIVLSKGKIIFSEKKNYIASFNDVNFNLLMEKDFKKIKLKGKFLNDKISIKINSLYNTEKPHTDILIKMSNLNLISKIHFFNSKDKKLNGNILIKKDKNKFTSIFDYENNEMNLSKSNVRNPFIDGKLDGKIKFLPFFNFNLDLNLNSVNFTKLYNYFLSLSEEKQKNLFNINKKINGNLSFSSNKVYSSYNLIKSFESRLKFNNGNVDVEQFLFNLGKLGAADISGKINNNKKFINFKYESNVFIDNKKKFLSKFGIYDKKNKISNLFISGNFDFKKIKNSFYEISAINKINNEDVNFIENEFNNYVLGGDYSNLFRFPKFKEFIKSITNEIN